MPNVLFLTSLVPEVAQQVIAPAPDDYRIDILPQSALEGEKIATAQEADFLILFPDLVPDAVLRAAPRLKLIQLVSAGFDRLNLPLCRELGIPIANNGGANAIDVAEHTLSLILAFYRRLIELDRNVRGDRWRAINTGLSTYTLHGKTVGLVGLGNIGQRVAALLTAFGVRVLFYDPYPPADEVVANLGAEPVSLAELLTRSDVVSLHVPLLPQTRGLIGREELARMKSTALLVNTCRGPVVDELALTEALQGGELAGAALDVLAQEPPDPTNPLLTLPNVLFTPHSAGVTYDTWARRGEFIFRNLERVRAGEPPLAVVS